MEMTENGGMRTSASFNLVRPGAMHSAASPNNYFKVRAASLFVLFDDQCAAEVRVAYRWAQGHALDRMNVKTRRPAEVSVYRHPTRGHAHDGRGHVVRAWAVPTGLEAALGGMRAVGEGTTDTDDGVADTDVDADSPERGRLPSPSLFVGATTLDAVEA